MNDWLDDEDFWHHKTYLTRAIDLCHWKIMSANGDNNWRNFFRTLKCHARHMLKAWYKPSSPNCSVRSPLTRSVSFNINHPISCSVVLNAGWTTTAYYSHTWGRVEVGVTTWLDNHWAIDMLALSVLLLHILEALSFCPGRCQPVWHPSFCVIDLITWKRITITHFISDRLNAHNCSVMKMVSCSYLVLCGRRVQAWWQGWSWGGGPEEILVLLIVNVPSIVGAAGKLMKARGLFRLEIVELGLCVFGIPAEGRMGRSNRQKKGKKDRILKNWMLSLTAALVVWYTQNLKNKTKKTASPTKKKRAIKHWKSLKQV